MCGRFSITATEEELEKRFDSDFYTRPLQIRYNIAPTHPGPVITNGMPHSIQMFRWGLVPFWAKDLNIGYKMINARGETLAEKPAFRKAFQKRRCMVLADGYYEWIKSKQGKIPYRITLKDEQPFAMAGLWETWKDAEEREIHTFTVITVDASPGIAHIHDRMPAILLPDEERVWLNEDLEQRELQEVLKPYPDDALKAYTVTQKVNSPKNQEPELVKPVVYGETGELF